MNLLGLIWIASVMGSFLSPQNLLKSYDSFSKVLSAKAWDLVNTTLVRTRSSYLSTVPTAANRGFQPRFAKETAFSVAVAPSFTQKSDRPPITALQLSTERFLQPNYTDRPFHSQVTTALSVRPATYFPFTFPTHLFSQLPLPSLTFAKLGGESSVQPVSKLMTPLLRWSQTVEDELWASVPLVTVVPVSRLQSEPASSQRSGCNFLPFRTSTQKFYQVKVRNTVILETTRSDQAEAIAEQLKTVLYQENFDPSQLRPAIVDQMPAVKVGNDVLLTLDSKLARSLGQNHDLASIGTVNQFRKAFSLEPLSLTAAQTKLYNLAATDERLEGIASWYGPYFHGRLTAAGEIFDQNELTAAHPSLPFNTYLKVTNTRNGRSVIVRINDRGPYVGRRSLDLSRNAARCLGAERVGVIRYEAVIMEPLPTVTAERPASTVQQIARRP